MRDSKRTGLMVMLFVVSFTIGPILAQAQEKAGKMTGTVGEAASKSPSAFKPTDIPGLVLWLDAADPKTLYEDPAKSKPIASGGKPIGAWADKSGKGNDAMQEAAVSRPSFHRDVRNGNSAVSFDGASDWLNANGVAPSFGPVNWTVFLVVQPNLPLGGGGHDDDEDGGGAMVALMATDPASRNKRRGFQVPPPMNLEYKNRSKQGKGDVKTKYAPSGDWEIWEFVNDNYKVSILVNGDEQATGTVGPAEQNVYSETSIGAKKMRNAPGAKDLWNGYIGEIVFYSAVKNQKDRKQVRSYLASKWDIAPGARGTVIEKKKKKKGDD